MTPPDPIPPAAGEPVLPISQRIAAAHALYCRMTGMNLRLDPTRERLWFDWFQAGNGRKELVTVIAWLQTQIRLRKRNLGCLRIGNLLQPDRFEEDLALSTAKLRAPLDTLPRPVSDAPEAPTLTPEQIAAGKADALAALARLKESL